MTDLIRDLEAVVGLRNKRLEAARLHDDSRWNDLMGETENAMDWFISEHHAEIAEAVRDAARYRALKELTRKGWTVTRASSRGGVFQYIGDDLDPAIDAMHDSAGDEG